MKASDVDDAAFLRAVQSVQEERHMWACWWDLDSVFPDVPPKVLLAKARRLIDRGYLTGCGCGCRGDFEVVGLPRVWEGQTEWRP